MAATEQRCRLMNASTSSASAYGRASLNVGESSTDGLHITQVSDNGIKLEGSYNIIKSCTFSYNDDTGLQLGFGHNFKTSVEQSYGVSVSSNDGSKQ